MNNIKKLLVTDGNNITVMHVAFHAMILGTPDSVYKVEYEKHHTILKEYANYQIIMTDYCAIVQYLPAMQLFQLDGRQYLKLERLYECPSPQNIEFALQIFHVFSIYSQKRKIYLHELKEVCHGIELVAMIYGNKISRAIAMDIERYLHNTFFRIGPVHGDFHSRNILMDKNGRPKIIDLDCFRTCAIQIIDVFYYIVELQYSNDGVLWYDTVAHYEKNQIKLNYAELISLIDNEIDREFLLLYFLDRIGQDKLYFNIHYPKQAYEPFIKSYL